MLFVYIKMFSKKMVFVYEWKLRRLPSLKDYADNYIRKKQIQLRNVFIYKKPDTFQKVRQFPLRFIYKKAIYLTLRDFHEIFEVGIYIQKAWHFALRDVFISKKLYKKRNGNCVAFWKVSCFLHIKTFRNFFCFLRI